MTHTPAPHPSAGLPRALQGILPASSNLPPLPHVSRFALLCIGRGRFCALTFIFPLSLIFAGCAAQQTPRTKTFPWATAASVRPMPLNVKTFTDVAPDDSVGALALDVPPPPSPLAVTYTAPQRPRIPTVAAAPSTPSRPEPPQITPQLTAQETAAAQQQTTVSLSIAEHNVAASQGRTLNATQSDLASKVRSFVAEARDAANVGDWTRASSAAKKAQVLSEELARSL